MMNTRLLTGALLVAVLISAGCKKKAHNVACTSAPIDVWGLGFPMKDTLADVTRYYPDNAFDSVIDSVRVLNFAFDTVFYPTIQNLVLAPGYDYRIVLPATKNTFLLSNVKYGHHFNEEISSGTGSVCYNPVISYRINDSAVIVTDTTRTRAAFRLYVHG